ncbi:hypothetical protein [Caulobacter segnis]|uniref:hypothetical protein n=1 Tax=Caulobacter segnis TaxID=88688 RepID=UPI001CBFD13F|nr:hypothetical protein [Caulobacter segnis]UAL11232.1 hypothetical protein K8940_02720 [Caulobacter segnis]
MSKDVKLKPPVSPAVLFRGRIEAAIGEGVSVEAMVLRLTLNDGRRLRRDDNVPLDQISYLGGQMHFLGVRVMEGGVDVSVLERVEPT